MITPEEIREYSRLRRLAFPEICRGNSLRYRKKNLERTRKAGRDYYHRNIEARRAYGRKRHASDPSYQRESSRRWRHKYPERSRNLVQRRRAERKQAIVSNCSEKIKEIRSSNECHWCGRIGKVEVDHVIPIARKGSHHPGNLVACCRVCNGSKGDKLYWEWDGELAA